MTQREHAEQLAASINARIFYDVSELEAFAETRRREVHLAEWHDGPINPTYWSALHELGHVATEPPSKDFFAELFGIADPTITHWEAIAWQWALDNALEPPDDAARASIAASLGTYLAIHGIPEDTSAVEAVVRHVGVPDWSLTPEFITDDPQLFSEAVEKWELLASQTLVAA